MQPLIYIHLPSPCCLMNAYMQASTLILCSSPLGHDSLQEIHKFEQSNSKLGVALWVDNLLREGDTSTKQAGYPLARLLIRERASVVVELGRHGLALHAKLW